MRAGTLLLALGGTALQVGLSASPALVSLGGAVAAAGGLLHFQYSASFHKPLVRGVLLCWAILFVCVLLGAAYPGETSAWLMQLKQKAPILLASTALLGASEIVRPQLIRLWAWALVIGVTYVSAHSLLHYFINKDVIDFWVMHGKEVPVIRLTANPFHYQEGYISHIYFGALMAFAAFVALWLGRNCWLANKRVWAYAAFGLGIWLVGAQHIFTSRTGILALYIGVAVLGIGLLLQPRFRKWAFVGAGLAVLLAVGSFFASNSIRHRVDITIQDIQNLSAGGDLSEWSLGRRYAVYACAAHVWQRHPFLGVGPASARDSLLAQYANESFTVTENMRLRDPHNQYLEWLVSYGALGAFLLIGAALGVFIRFRREAHGLLAVLVVQAAAAMFFESLLERQVGLNYILWWTLSLALVQSVAKR